jgi:hypothetical protein
VVELDPRDRFEEVLRRQRRADGDHRIEIRGSRVIHPVWLDSR